MELISLLIARLDLHILTISTLIFIILYIYPLIKKSKIPSKYIKYTAISVLLLEVIDIFCIGLITIKNPELVKLTKIVYTLSYSTGFSLFYLVALCLHTYLLGAEPSKKLKIILFIPFIINIILVISNLFIPVYFEIESPSVFVRYAPSLINTILGQAYGFYIFYLLIRYRKQANTKTKLTFFLIILMPIIVSIVELAFDLDALLFPISSLCVIIVLIHLKTNNCTVDSTTKISNYNVLNTKIDEFTDKKENNYILCLIDIDNLGDINKKYSFNEGNIILEEIGQIIEKNLPENSYVNYINQDEYLIYFNTTNIEEVDNSLLIIENNIRNSTLSNNKDYSITYTCIKEVFNIEKYDSPLDLIKYLYYKLNQEKLKSPQN